ncbi:endonuclease MutS2 [Balneolales bacterium ANBcel1]|nr:endonuclease MutS2 [Balneolales bacterium ANBcel1]
MHTLPAFAESKLEFDKIRDVLAGYLSTPTGALEVERLEPAAELETVTIRLECSAEMMHLLDASTAPPLETLYDITEALSRSKVERFVLDGVTLVQILRWAESARKLRAFFSQHKEPAERLWEIAGKLVTLKELESHIRGIVDENGEAKPDASPELARITKKIQTRKQNARSVLQRILKQGRESGMTSDEEATLRAGRLVIPVKAEYKRKIKGFIHDTSATGQTVYIEPLEVFENNNEIRELESERNREIERLLRELTAHVGAVADTITANSLLIGKLDAVYACARLGIRWEGTIPDVSADGRLSLGSCRNPLLLMKFKRFDDGRRQVVPLHLEMAPDDKGIIITGPNAGGKSVTLKTFGLSIMLAHCGIPVPAQEGAIIPFTSGIYIDMGDEQSIDNDLSTFSSRLNWMKKVLDDAGPASWVLMDEAGSGTDPDEGTALVQGFLEILSEKRVRSLVTTHHGALKVFAHETPGWSNASMEFDQKTLSPTYMFRKGIPGSSYAFEIADRLNVPGELTRRAREWVGESKNRMESLIISLEQEAQELQSRRDDVARQQRSIADSRQKLESRLSRIEDERDAIRRKALDKADTLLKDANRKIEEAIRAAAEKDKESLKKKREEVKQLDTSVRKQRKQRTKVRSRHSGTGQPPSTGDFVRLIDSNAVGELVEISGKKATVDVNGLRLKTRYDNLERTERAVTGKKPEGYRIRINRAESRDARPFSPRLDIRGKRGDEAVREVTRFVDEGLSRGIQQLSIIHGRGDGILRKLVHEHLQARADVTRFEAAPIEEGGDGCTYVYL